MRISIIIPAYNKENYIGRCISSILSQNFPEDYEIIVVNDCSNDKTSQIVAEFQKENTNLALINNTERIGIAASRNEGFKSSTGDIIAFIDGNCIASEKWLINILYSLKEGSAIIGPTIIKFYNNPLERIYSRPNLIGNIFNKTGLPIYSAGNNCAFFRDFFSELGGYNNILLEDFDIAIRASKEGQISYEKIIPVFLSSPKVNISEFFKSNLHLANNYIKLLIGKPTKI